MTDRGRRLAFLAPILLVAALAVAWQLPEVGWLRLASSDTEAAARMTSTLDGLDEEPLVLVGFDADVGTYAEIRPTVRALLADLLARDASLAFVSLTAEGRALASAELGRLVRGGTNPARLLDLGFIAGAEAGLVDLTRGIRLMSGEADEAFARDVAAGDMEAFDALLVVGGNDLGPRSWIEQVAPRIGAIPLVAVTPTILLPEVQPYLARGALAAALGTPPDGAAYRDSLDPSALDGLADPREPRPLPVFVGILVAIAVLAQALGARTLDALRAARPRDVG